MHAPRLEVMKGVRIGGEWVEARELRVGGEVERQEMELGVWWKITKTL